MEEFTGTVEQAVIRGGDVTESDITFILEGRLHAEYPELAGDDLDVEGDAELICEGNVFLIEGLATVGGRYAETRAAVMALWTGTGNAVLGVLGDTEGNGVVFDDEERTITLTHRDVPVQRIQY